jgi:hypothetical protein
MGQEYLIDSNAAIDYLSAKLPEAGMFLMKKAVNAIPLISVITKIEVLSFIAPEDSAQVLTDFIDSSILLDLSDDVINNTISLRKIQRIKTPDAIIAATALVYNLTLITRNEEDFKNIPNLNIINPWKITQ